MKTKYTNEKNKIYNKRNLRIIAISFMLFFSTFTGKAQTIYFEDFNWPDGTNNDNGKTAWTRDVSGADLSDGGDLFVIFGLFAGYDLDGEGVWRSEVLDISSFPAGVDISMDAFEIGDLEGNDYIRFYYKIDGGGEILIQDLTNDFDLASVSVSGLTGSTVQLVVRMSNNDDANEAHGFDNVYVHSTATDITLYTTANGDWDDETTWSVYGFGNTACNCYPDATSDVYVGNNNTINLNVGANTENITVNSTGSINYTADNVDLYVGAGSNFTLESGGTFSENGRTNAFVYFQGTSGTSQLINNGGTFTVDGIYKTGSNALQFNGTGSVTTGDIRLNATGTLTNNLSGNLNVNSLLYFTTSNSTFVNNGTISVGNDVEFSNDNHTLTNNGTITITDDIVSGTGDNNNLITNNAGAIINIGDAITLGNGNMTINNAGTINQTGNFTNGSIDNGSSFNNLDGGIWNWSYPGTDYDASLNNILDCSTGTNTFSYNANGNQNIIPVTYSHLTLSGSGTKTTQNNLDVNGNLTLSGTATLDVASGAYNITLAGNWINTGGTFTEGTQTVTFDGNNDQSVSNAAGETFYHVTVNKSSGLVTLANANVLVNGNLTLTAGNVTLGDYNLTLGAAGSIVSGSATSFVVTDGDGQLIQDDLGSGARTGDILFPVGAAAGSYTPITINNSTGTADNFGIKICSGIYNNGSCGSGSVATEDVVNRSWFITEAVAGGSDAILTFQWNAGNELTNFDRNDLTIVHHNGTEWEEIAYTAAAGTDPYTATATGVTSFSPFGLKTTNTSTLPIELMSFSASLDDNQVNLQWITASELNNDFFTIEKTSDFKTFEAVATVKGKGTFNGSSVYNTSDHQPYTGVSYYRLKQTDFDGNFTYSEFVTVNNNGNSTLAVKEVKLYPVPNAGDRMNLSLSGISAAQNLSLTVFDLTGFVVYANQVSIAENEEFTIDFKEKLNPGIYTLKLGNNSQPVFKKFVVR